MEQFDVAIVGAGIAGIATAYHLVRRGAGRVVIVDAAETPAFHASGRNAGIFRQAVLEPANLDLALETGALLAGGELGLGLVARTGALYVARDVERLRPFAGALARRGVAAEIGDPARLPRASVLAGGAPSGQGLWVPSDGVIDIHALASALLSGARRGGARVLLRTKVHRVLRSEGRATGLATDAGEIRAGAVVLAAGAWAASLARSSGIAPPPLRPCRRHLAVLDPDDPVDPSSPVVWDLQSAIYLRPESGGLLGSPCDEDEIPVRSDPEPPDQDPRVIERFAESLAAAFPRLRTSRVRTTWACIRTLTPDGNFVVGEDPLVHRLFWVAGLGGHGMSAGPAAGRLAADLIAGNAADTHAASLSPGRFVQ